MTRALLMTLITSEALCAGDNVPPRGGDEPCRRPRHTRVPCAGGSSATTSASIWWLESANNLGGPQSADQVLPNSHQSLTTPRAAAGSLASRMHASAGRGSSRSGGRAGADPGAGAAVDLPVHFCRSWP
jgi:hypothetical protein